LVKININQSINQSIKQSINRSINQIVYISTFTITIQHCQSDKSEKC